MTYKLTVERIYDASPEEVFDAFVDPDAHEDIFAGPPTARPSCSNLSWICGWEARGGWCLVNPAETGTC
jgi:uncharacterized protein YndB with AHSA1/START domain